MSSLPRAFGRATLFAFVSQVVVAVSLTAQVTSSPTTAPRIGEIHGRVVTADKTPVAGARVEVAIVGVPGVIARGGSVEDGSFRVRGVPAGRFRVRVTAIGYAPKDIAGVEVSVAAPSADVGTIALTSKPPELTQVRITGEEEKVQLAPDRNAYVVKDMPSTRGGNALDVLRNVPSVDVDIDNVVSLRGNSGVLVQINGRLSPLKAAQLGDFLAQLPADMVEKVEVIPNPSAKDDPEGSAGIINIIMKKEPDAGTSGSMTTSASTRGHYDVGGSYGYQKGPLTAYGTYSLFRDNRPSVQALMRDNLFAVPTTYLDETGDRTTLQHGQTISTRLGYQLGKADELTFDGLYSYRVEYETDSIVYRNLNPLRVLASTSDRQTINNNDRYNLDATIGWRHNFDQKQHRLTVEARATRTNEWGPLEAYQRQLAADLTPLLTTTREQQFATDRPGENSLKADYVRPLSTFWRLEAGYKGSMQQLLSRFDVSVLNPVSSLYAPDSTRTSNVDYRLTVNAAYALVSGQVGPLLLQGGLRAEHASTAYRLFTTGAEFDNRYNSLFPSGLIAWNITDADQVKLSYSTRIRRPDNGFQLNPTPQVTDALNIGRGNPFLKPEYIRSIEFGYQRTGNGVTLQITPFYRRTDDAIRQIRTIDTLGVTTRTFDNVATTNAFGVDGTIGLTGGKVTGFVGASGYRQVSDASNLGPNLSATATVWTARANTAWRVNKTLDVQVLIQYRAPQTVEQGSSGRQLRVSFSVRQKLMAERLALTLRIIDPFNTANETSTTIDPRFIQVSDRTRIIRGLLVSANWTFGARRRQPEREREPDDTGGH